VGLATSLEVTRAEQLLLSSRQDLLEANNTLKSSRVLLLELLRIPSEEDLEIKGELNYLPVEVEAGRSIELALEKRPELVNLRERILFQQQNIEIARAGLRPNVSVSGTWSYDDPANGGTDGDDTWSVKMKVDLPLYDNGITRGKVTQEEASLRQAQNALSSQEDSVRTEITTLYLDLGSADSRVKETARNVELAMEALRLAEVGYREGVGIQLDVLDARRALTQARLSHSAAIKDHVLILASLMRAEGRLISYSLNGEDFKE
ncbi:MAG TPA: TolC family protein, partial [Synergistales bacterium]|nr:TolC family protein [Synergistales bacterium]